MMPTGGNSRRCGLWLRVTGLEVVTELEFWRGKRDKGDPATYTLEVMRRGRC